MSGPDLRASDEDRERVTAALQRHTSAGRLTLDEYAERVDRALAARTHAELAEVTRDLPAGTENPVPASHPPGGTGDAGRQLALAFLLSIVALIVLGALLVAGR